MFLVLNIFSVVFPANMFALSKLPKVPIINSSYEELLKSESVNTLKFPGNDFTFVFNYDDFQLEHDDFYGIIDTGIVKKFTHRPTDTKMAVKSITIPIINYYDGRKMKKMKKLMREIEIHQKIHSKYVVQLYGVCIHKGEFLICMELMEMSLSELYPKVHLEYSWFHEYLLGYIVTDIVNGLCDLYKNKILHRDIKPNNILVNTKSGEVRFLH